MDSAINNPLWLAFAQIVVLVLSGLLYNRQKGALDLEKRDRGAFGRLVDNAVNLATEAKGRVETIEIEHYKKLAAAFTACCTEQAMLQAKVKSLEESLASLGNKLASRDRADRRAAKAAQLDDDDQVVEEAKQTPSGTGIPPEVLAQLGAIPLTAKPAVPAAPQASNFGKALR